MAAAGAGAGGGGAAGAGSGAPKASAQTPLPQAAIEVEDLYEMLGVSRTAGEAEIKKAFDAGETALKALDTNNDGKLDEAELAVVKAPAPPAKEKKKKN